jgi:sugar lactone lactonase YvrE
MQFEPILTGYYLEALGVRADGVWFSDVAQGGIRRRAADGSIGEWWPGRRMVGGILFNEDGCVLCSGPGGIAWFDPATGATGMLLESIAGEPIGGVNEMLPDGNGGLYFGTVDLPSILRGDKPRSAAIYRLDTGGAVTCLREGLRFSNGMGLSPDRRTLYHNETFVGTFAYNLASDGSLGPARPLLEKRDCDGMTVDCEGNIWITGCRSPKIVRLAPDGTVINQYAVPAEASTNVRFGGDDGQDLYLTAVALDAVNGLVQGVLPSAPTSTLFRTRAPVAGQQIPPTRFRLG